MKKVLRKLAGERLYTHLHYRRHYRRLINLNGFRQGRTEGEEEYIAKWRQLSRWVEPYGYRLFSHFCGPTPDIVPEDILHNIIEPIISPSKFWKEYEDKNNFATIVGREWVPQTVLFRRNGGPIGNLQAALDSPYDALILKPSLNSSCGEQVMKFFRRGDQFLAADGTMLTEEFLRSYTTDFVLQEAIVQHPFTAQFNSSSVNTIRLALYRRKTDDHPVVTAAVLRIGKTGACVDNALAGGRYVGVNICTGQLGNYTATHLGEISNQWNGVDFSIGDYVVPVWERVLKLAEHVGNQLNHTRLTALDIAIRADGTPVLIEYNIGGFSTYFFHFTGQTVFGPYTDEVLTLPPPRSR